MRSPHFYPFISLTSLICSSLAGTPPKYPFDKPTFGEVRCDNSLQYPPAENRRLKEAAERKLDEKGPDGRPKPANSRLQLSLFKDVNIGIVASSPDPSAMGVLPGALFQYWERPLLYQVYTSDQSERLFHGDITSLGKRVSNLASDVLNTCCRAGYAGTTFAPLSHNHGDYIEVYVLYSPNRPTGNPLAPSSRQSQDFGDQPLSPQTGRLSQQDRSSREGRFSFSRDGRLSRDGRFSREGQPQSLALSLYRTSLTQPESIMETPEHVTIDIPDEALPPSDEDRVPASVRGSRAGSTARVPVSGGSTAVTSLHNEDIRQLLRECRDAMVEINVRGQAAEREAVKNAVREYSANKCIRGCQKFKDWSHNVQGMVGVCICCVVTIGAPFSIYGALT